MDRTVAVTAALLAALSPFQVMYAQEARSYTLVAFFLIASTYFFLRAGLEQRRGDWTLYVVALVLGLYTQTIVGLGVLIQAALFVFLPPLRRGIKGWLTALTVALVLYIPWLVAAHSQTQHLAESHWYLDRPGVRDIFHVLRGIAIAPIPLVTSPNEALQPGLEAVMPRSIGQFLLFALPGVPILLGLWAARRSDPAGAMARTGIAGLLAPLGAVIALSWFSPRLLPRFFVFESTFLCLLMAAGLAAMRPGGLATLWTLLLVVMGFYGIERYDVDYTKERWRDAVQFVDVSGMSGRKAALVTFDIDPFAFYNSRLANPMPAFEYSHPEVPFSHAFTPAQLTDMQRRGAANLRDFDEVWVFTRDPKSGTRLEAVKQARTLAAEGRRFVGEWRWDATGGPVRVACWRR
jgi:hypothetical protein